jgi:crossover junction endodeoxyribonuclease RuvC
LVSTRPVAVRLLRRRRAPAAAGPSRSGYHHLPGDPLPQRLAELQGELRDIIAEFSPSVAAVERVLFQVNVRTAMSVGQASGIAMAEAATAGCEVVQYSPNQVKQAVAGHGGADKLQIQQMVQTLLGLPALPEPPQAALRAHPHRDGGLPARLQPAADGGVARGGRIKNLAWPGGRLWAPATHLPPSRPTTRVRS